LRHDQGGSIAGVVLTTAAVLFRYDQLGSVPIWRLPYDLALIILWQVALSLSSRVDWGLLVQLNYAASVGGHFFILGKDVALWPTGEVPALCSEVCSRKVS